MTPKAKSASISWKVDGPTTSTTFDATGGRVRLVTSTDGCVRDAPTDPVAQADSARTATAIDRFTLETPSSDGNHPDRRGQAHLLA
jgi:hypothetical protein